MKTFPLLRVVSQRAGFWLCRSGDRFAIYDGLMSVWVVLFVSMFFPGEVVRLYRTMARNRRRRCDAHPSVSGVVV